MERRDFLKLGILGAIGALLAPKEVIAGLTGGELPQNGLMTPDMEGGLHAIQTIIEQGSNGDMQLGPVYKGSVVNVREGINMANAKDGHIMLLADASQGKLRELQKKDPRQEWFCSDLFNVGNGEYIQMKLPIVKPDNQTFAWNMGDYGIMADLDHIKGQIVYTSGGKVSLRKDTGIEVIGGQRVATVGLNEWPFKEEILKPGFSFVDGVSTGLVVFNLK